MILRLPQIIDIAVKHIFFTDSKGQPYPAAWEIDAFFYSQAMLQFFSCINHFVSPFPGPI